MGRHPDGATARTYTLRLRIAPEGLAAIDEARGDRPVPRSYGKPPPPTSVASPRSPHERPTRERHGLPDIGRPSNPGPLKRKTQLSTSPVAASPSTTKPRCTHAATTSPEHAALVWIEHRHGGRNRPTHTGKG